MIHDTLPPDGTTPLEPIAPRLYATAAAPLPILAGVVVRSFVLEREDGNVIVYNSPGIDASADAMLALGRPTLLLVNHWPEAMYDAPDLDVPDFVHESDRAQTARALPIAGVFTRRETIGTDLQIIPTPGHTAGATTFLWDSGEHRYLFVGDTIWVHDGRWEVVLLGESNRAAYLDSLRVLGRLDFDVLVPWGADAEDAILHPLAGPGPPRDRDAHRAHAHGRERVAPVRPATAPS